MAQREKTVDRSGMRESSYYIVYRASNKREGINYYKNFTESLRMSKAKMLKQYHGNFNRTKAAISEKNRLSQKELNLALELLYGHQTAAIQEKFDKAKQGTYRNIIAPNNSGVKTALEEIEKFGQPKTKGNGVRAIQTYADLRESLEWIINNINDQTQQKLAQDFMGYLMSRAGAKNTTLIQEIRSKDLKDTLVSNAKAAGRNPNDISDSEVILAAQLSRRSKDKVFNYLTSGFSGANLIDSNLAKLIIILYALEMDMGSGNLDKYFAYVEIRHSGQSGKQSVVNNTKAEVFNAVGQKTERLLNGFTAACEELAIEQALEEFAKERIKMFKDIKKAVGPNKKYFKQTGGDTVQIQWRRQINWSPELERTLKSVVDENGNTAYKTIGNQRCLADVRGKGVYGYIGVSVKASKHTNNAVINLGGSGVTGGTNLLAYLVRESHFTMEQLYTLANLALSRGDDNIESNSDEYGKKSRSGQLIPTCTLDNFWRLAKNRILTMGAVDALMGSSLKQYSYYMSYNGQVYYMHDIISRLGNTINTNGYSTNLTMSLTGESAGTNNLDRSHFWEENKWDSNDTGAFTRSQHSWEYFLGELSNTKIDIGMHSIVMGSGFHNQTMSTILNS